jgi:hypothetical protein
VQDGGDPHHRQCHRLRAARDVDTDRPRRVLQLADGGHHLPLALRNGDHRIERVADGHLHESDTLRVEPGAQGSDFGRRHLRRGDPQHHRRPCVVDEDLGNGLLTGPPMGCPEARASRREREHEEIDRTETAEPVARPQPTAPRDPTAHHLDRHAGPDHDDDSGQAERRVAPATVRVAEPLHRDIRQHRHEQRRDEDAPQVPRRAGEVVGEPAAAGPQDPYHGVSFNSDPPTRGGTGCIPSPVGVVRAATKV